MTLKEFIEECGEEKDHHQVSMKSLYEGFKSTMDDYAKDQAEDPKVIAVKNLGLTIEDYFFILFYTGSCSSWLNCDKRNCNDYSTECKKYFASGLEVALQKLPIFEGTAYRWEEADDDLRKFNWFKNKIGSTIKTPYFLSTAKDNITSQPMIWDINTISTGNGKDISAISNNPHEQEILFLPNAKFKIIGVGDDNKTVFMQELSQDTETEFNLCRAYDHDGTDPDMDKPGLFD